MRAEAGGWIGPAVIGTGWVVLEKTSRVLIHLLPVNSQDKTRLVNSFKEVDTIVLSRENAQVISVDSGSSNSFSCPVSWECHTRAG